MRCFYLLPMLLFVAGCGNHGTTDDGSPASASPRAVSRSGCAPVFAALRKVTEQERVGQYVFAGLDDPLDGEEPLVKRIGDKAYADLGGTIHEESRVDAERRMIRNLEAAAAAGGATICESLGEATARGERVQRYRFPNPMKEIAIQAGRPGMADTVTLWISESSGLPIYQETLLTMGGQTETVGTVFVYGDAVRRP